MMPACVVGRLANIASSRTRLARQQSNAKVRQEQLCPMGAGCRVGCDGDACAVRNAARACPRPTRTDTHVCMCFAKRTHGRCDACNSQNLGSRCSDGVTDRSQPANIMRRAPVPRECSGCARRQRGVRWVAGSKMYSLQETQSGRLLSLTLSIYQSAPFCLVRRKNTFQSWIQQKPLQKTRRS